MVDDSDIRWKTYGKRRSIRLPGWDYSLPAVYHVTLTSYRRANWFDAPVLAGAFVDALREQVVRTHYSIHAFCVMPDHIHILCQPNAQNPVMLEHFVQRVKSTATHRLHLLAADGVIWQRGFYDHILRRDEDVLPVTWHILANPVRAGLTEDFEHYPFSYAPEFKRYTGPRNVVDLPIWKPAT